MISTNKVELIGHLGKDPEIRTMQNGERMASLSLATSESWKDKATNEWKNNTEWHRVAIYEPDYIDFCEKISKKEVQ